MTRTVYAVSEDDARSLAVEDIEDDEIVEAARENGFGSMEFATHECDRV